MSPSPEKHGWSVGVKLRLALACVAGPLVGAVALLLRELGPSITAPHLIIVMAIAAVSVVLGLAVTGRTTSRFTRLARAAERLRRGEPGASLPEDGADELGRLGAAFNEILRQTQRANSDLLQLVDEHAETLELQYSILDNAAEYGILSEDLQGRVTTANKGAQDLFGADTRDALVGRRFSNLIAATHRESAAEYAAATDRGETWHGRLSFQRLDGAAFVARVRAAPRRDGASKVAGRVLILRDITKELEAERRYGDLFQSLQEAVYVTTRDGRFLDANEAMARLIGMESADALRGLDAHTLYADTTDRQAWLQLVEERGFIRDHEVSIRAYEGEVRTCIESTRALRGPDGAIHAYLGTLVDVTERRRLQRQVARSQRLDAVGTLASGLAHDFNNILSAIVPNAELIERNPDTPENARERARTIRAAAERAGGITRQLLRFAREEYDARNAVDLNQVVAESSRLLEASFKAGVTYTTSLDPHTPAVLGDATSLHQIIVNLVLNARDAVGESGTIRVTTRAQHADAAFCRNREGLQPGDYGVLVIEDDGCGMAQEQLDRIFDPFYTTKGSGVGTGLGLSVVYAIISGYHGAVCVDSEPGRGTSFEVFLPEPAKTARADDDAARDADADCVLVLDDEEIVRQAAASILEGLGWRHEPAADGSDGVNAFRARRREFAAILVDDRLPDLAPTLERLRGIDRAVPVLLMGAPGRRAGPAAAHGAAGFVEKPLRADELAAALAACREPAVAPSSD